VRRGADAVRYGLQGLIIISKLYTVQAELQRLCVNMIGPAGSLTRLVGHSTGLCVPSCRDGPMA
jgi:hypothetical protein